MKAGGDLWNDDEWRCLSHDGVGDGSEDDGVDADGIFSSL